MLQLCGGFGSPTQCFPFYIYDEDGANRRENLTDWALAQFRVHYRDEAIGKWDIFHYIYALLHHPAYRQKYAANLRRELPRIPFAPDFHAFAAAGARLADLHVNYEQQPEYPLEWLEKPGAPLDWRVERMKLSGDKTEIIYNNFLTLKRRPPGGLRLQAGQPLGLGMGHRPVPGLHRQAQRHHQRPQPPRRPRIHRPPPGPGDHRQPGNLKDHQGPARLWNEM